MLMFREVELMTLNKALLGRQLKLYDVSFIIFQFILGFKFIFFLLSFHVLILFCSIFIFISSFWRSQKGFGSENYGKS